MKEKVVKIVGGAAVLSLIISTTSFNFVKAASGQVTQIGGKTSYDTAAQVATTNWTSSDNVILVSGEGYADSISSAVLSKQLNAPILLTESKTLNSSAKNAIDELNPKNIYIIGGTGSISQSIRDQLKGSNYNIIELGGENRYDTNAAVAQKLVELGVDPSAVMMVGGNGFADALSAASVAAAKDEILLLGNDDETAMKSVMNFVKQRGSKVTVVGTIYTVGDKVYKDINAISRIQGGSDRFDTNIKVLNSFKDSLNSNKIYIANANGDRYQDALISASLAGINEAPLVLISGDEDSQTQNALDYIKNNSAKSSDLNLISETGIVSDNTISKINSAVLGQGTDSDTVNSITANGLNQIKVVFNTEVDKNSAERVANYQMDGSNLGSIAETQSKAKLQEDGRTVVITFKNPFKQFKEVDFKVSNNILSKSASGSIKEALKHIQFKETGNPDLDSVTAFGGNKLVIKFSEPIRLNIDDLTSLKINRRSITSYGLNKTYSDLRNPSGDIGEGSYQWADGLDLYFNSPLPVGENNFTIPNGDAGSKLSNAANFPISSVSKDFTVKASSGNPKPVSVTSNGSDIIYVKYNEPMDQQTALEPTNYRINGNRVDVDDSYVSFDYNSDDTVVKIEKVGDLLRNGNNTIDVDDDVQDSFNNNITSNTLNLYIGDSGAQPEITSASILDSETIRIKFNKDVVRSYATDKGNYDIKDSDGNNINYKIKYISTKTVDGNNNRTFDIKFEDNSLNGLKYTLSVQNIVDTESHPNVMKSYSSVVSGTNDEGVKVTKIIKRADKDNAVTIFFSKTMNDSELQNRSNYLFQDGTGDNRSLPGNSTVTPSYDDKSVTIEFPSNYKVAEGSGTSSVIQVGVKNVHDQDGNPLDLLSYMGQVTVESETSGPKIIPGTAKMTFDGLDIVVQVSLTESLDTFDTNDFRVDGYKPDSGTTVGNDVILTYRSGVKNNEKINGIKNSGESTNLTISSTNSSDSAGRRIQTGSTIVYIPPMTKSDSFTASSNNYMNTVKVAFNQDIDNDIVTLYKDDFQFKDNTTGKVITPSAVSVDGRNVIYRFDNGAINHDDEITVTASNSSSINIRSESHNNSGYATYVPSREDREGYIITAN